MLTAYTNQNFGQCAPPSLTFVNPVLVSGTPGNVGAIYKFPFVTPTADAYISIDSIVGGASLINIDITTTGYQHAWQPVVDGPSSPMGHQYYIRWSVNFKTAGTNNPTGIPCLNLSAIDVDGDNVRMREFVETFNCVQHTFPTPSLLSISTFNTGSGMCTRAMGQVANKLNIDTNAHDTRINYDFGTTLGFQVKTGAQVNNNSTGPASTDRHFSLYFKNFAVMSSLPVRLLSFSGKALDEATIELKWVTEIEINNKQFELQRSLDGKEFATVAVVLSLDGSGTKAYSYKDALPAGAPSKVFYRIKQIDTDNKYSISNIITVNSARDNSVGMKISPNPVASDFAINLENNQQGAHALRILDISGRVVFRQSLNGQKIPVIRLSASQARMDTPGIYVAELVFQDGSRLTQKMIRQ
jgi:hypothetical protein